MIYLSQSFSRGGWTVYDEGDDPLPALSRLTEEACQAPTLAKARNLVWAWGDVPEKLAARGRQPAARFAYPRLTHVFLDYDHLSDEDVEALRSDARVPGLRVSSFNDGATLGVRKLHLVVPLEHPVSVPYGEAASSRSEYAGAVREVNEVVGEVLGRQLSFARGGEVDAASLEVTRLCFFSGHYSRALPVNEIVPGRFPNTPPARRSSGKSHTAGFVTSPASSTRDFREGETPEAWLTRRVPTLPDLAQEVARAYGQEVLFQNPLDRPYEWRYRHTDGSDSTRGGVRAAYAQGAIMTAAGEATAPEGTVALHSTSLDWRTGFISTAEFWMALSNYYAGGGLSADRGTLPESGPSAQHWEDFLRSLGLWDEYEAERTAMFEAASSPTASEEEVARAEEALRSSLARNKKGAPLPTLANQMMLLSMDPLCRMITRDMFTGQLYLPPEMMLRLGVPPEQENLYDRLFLPRLSSYIGLRYGEGLFPSEEKAQLRLLDAVPDLRLSTRVRDYLLDLEPSDGGLLEESIPWAVTDEGKDRVARFLIAAYHQMMYPGEAYEPILVLDEPVGGVGKTSFLTYLFAQANWRRWEPGRMLTDGVQQTLGSSWLVLDDDSSSLKNSAAVAETKAFQSSPGGAYRLLYSNAMQSAKFHTVTAITTNGFAPPQDTALRRRLLVVPCRGSREQGARLVHEYYQRPEWRDEVWSEVKYRYEVLGQRPEQPSEQDFSVVEGFVARTPVQEALEDLRNDLLEFGEPRQNGLPLDVEVLRPGGKWEGVPFIRVRGANQYLRQVGVVTNEGNSTHLAGELLNCGFVRGPKSVRVGGRIFSGVYYPVPEGGEL